MCALRWRKVEGVKVPQPPHHYAHFRLFLWSLCRLTCTRHTLCLHTAARLFTVFCFVRLPLLHYLWRGQNLANRGLNNNRNTASYHVKLQATKTKQTEMHVCIWTFSVPSIRILAQGTNTLQISMLWQHSSRTQQRLMHTRARGKSLFTVALHPVSCAVLTDPTPGGRNLLSDCD